MKSTLFELFCGIQREGKYKEKQHGDCELLFYDLIVVREMWDLGMFLGTIGHIFKKVVIAQNYRTGTSWGEKRSFQLYKVKHLEW